MRRPQGPDNTSYGVQQGIYNLGSPFVKQE